MSEKNTSPEVRTPHAGAAFELMKANFLHYLFMVVAELTSVVAFVAVVAFAMFAAEFLHYLGELMPHAAAELGFMAKSAKYVLFGLALLGLVKSGLKHLFSKH